MKDTNKIDLKKAGKDFAKRFTGVMSRLATEDTNTLREEFYKTDFTENIYRNKDMVDVETQNIADWWLNKFNQKLEEIEQGVEVKRKDVSEEFKKECFADEDHGIDRYYDNVTFNEGLDLALQIIKNKKI